MSCHMARRWCVIFCFVVVVGNFLPHNMLRNQITRKVYVELVCLYSGYSFSIAVLKVFISIRTERHCTCIGFWFFSVELSCASQEHNFAIHSISRALEKYGMRNCRNADIDAEWS